MWILNDTYPDSHGMQELYLYHVPTSRRVSLARFRALLGYEAELRCDLHPRFSRDGRRVFVDSAHEGGRQVYMIDIGQIL
jgi:Tol biopolymer transport system component